MADAAGEFYKKHYLSIVIQYVAILETLLGERLAFQF